MCLELQLNWGGQKQTGCQNNSGYVDTACIVLFEGSVVRLFGNSESHGIRLECWKYWWNWIDHVSVRYIAAWHLFISTSQLFTITPMSRSTLIDSLGTRISKYLVRYFSSRQPCACVVFVLPSNTRRVTTPHTRVYLNADGCAPLCT